MGTYSAVVSGSAVNSPATTRDAPHFSPQKQRKACKFHRLLCRFDIQSTDHGKEKKHLFQDRLLVWIACVEWQDQSQRTAIQQIFKLMVNRNIVEPRKIESRKQRVNARASSIHRQLEVYYYRYMYGFDWQGKGNAETPADVGCFQTGRKLLNKCCRLTVNQVNRVASFLYRRDYLCESTAKAPEVGGWGRCSQCVSCDKTDWPSLGTIGQWILPPFVSVDVVLVHHPLLIFAFQCNFTYICKFSILVRPSGIGCLLHTLTTISKASGVPPLE